MLYYPTFKTIRGCHKWTVETCPNIFVLVNNTLAVFFHPSSLSPLFPCTSTTRNLLVYISCNSILFRVNHPDRSSHLEWLNLCWSIISEDLLRLKEKWNLVLACFTLTKESMLLLLLLHSGNNPTRVKHV